MQGHGDLTQQFTGLGKAQLVGPHRSLRRMAVLLLLLQEPPCWR